VLSRSSPFALHMPHWPKNFGPEPQETPSERARTLLANLGHPEHHVPPVIHVGGTKGKGSTIAFLRAMLEAAGYNVHVYTSPHLARFNERIVLAGHEIEDATLHAALEETRIAAGDMQVGFFDATTAAAMLAFASTPADILLMEMGLGGTVDATNIIDNPLLTILTTVSYDHMEYMGSTLPEIAAFEAGLFKPHVPCVVSYQHASVWPALHAAADVIQAPLYEYGKHWQTLRQEGGMLYVDCHGEASLPLPSLLGVHQIVNAGNAIAALSALEHFHVSPEHIIHGLEHAEWKGRLQQIPAASVPRECELWFDGGHNQAAAEAIAFFASDEWQDKPLYLIFGTTEGKDVASILTPFTEMVTRVYAVSVKSEPRSYNPEAIAGAAEKMMPVMVSDSIHDALSDIIKREAQPFRALIFGSLYLWLEAISQ